MKKTLIATVAVIGLFASCESQDELVVIPSVMMADTLAEVKTFEVERAKISNPEKYLMVLTETLNRNSAGNYKTEDWLENWNRPKWANRKNGLGKMVKQGSNIYLSQSFARGSFNVSGGYQWHAKFKQGYDELYFSYKIKFSDGFKNKDLHGKLPGLSGGTSNSGGYLPSGKDGWSARLMFHGTQIKFYMYYPEVYKLFGDSKPIKKKSYWGMGPVFNPGFTLKTGVWYTITQRVVMNTPGKSNGLVEGFIDGKLCASQKGIRFRDISSLKIDKIFFANFFGASGKPPSKTESICFDDFAVYTYNPSVKVAKSLMANEEGTVIPLPL
jgi:hypothetical protein